MASDPKHDAEKGTELSRAAGYVRLSAEHSQHSQQNQKSAIHHYAETSKIHIAILFSEDSEVKLT
jgi:DNA invertase Pin-like site-specific DNA recombinase